MKNIKNVILTFIFILTQGPKNLVAGPPFITDDPNTDPHKHGEFYLGSTGNNSKNEFNAFLPFIEFDYGAFKNTQLHVIIPFSIDKKKSQSSHYGPGIIELGIKYRFIQETKNTPQVGFFPLIEAPTGNARKGLGKGKIQIFLPLWLQKSWGKKGQEWTAYGGGGYWFNPGKENKDYGFLGIVVQRQINKIFWMGVETFYHSKTKINEHQSVGFNVGGGINIHKQLQLTCSFGDDTKLGKFLYYVALYYKW